MQIAVWAAFKGYIACDKELDATRLKSLDEPDVWADVDPFWEEEEDPALEWFLAQNDGGSYMDQDTGLQDSPDDLTEARSDCSRNDVLRPDIDGPQTQPCKELRNALCRAKDINCPVGAALSFPL